METPKSKWIGIVIKVDGYSYKVIAELDEHLLVIPNTGIFPAATLAIPKRTDE